MTVRLQKGGKSRNINGAGWSSLVARRAHNPKVVSSNLTPATNLTDSQGLPNLQEEALLLFGKDLGKKSVFPFQSQAIHSRTIRQVSRPRSVHHRRKYGCNRPSHYFRYGPDAAFESAVGCQENPLLLPPCDENCAVLATPHVSRSALPVQWFSPSPRTSLVAGIDLRYVETVKHRVELSLQHVASAPRIAGRSLE